MQANDYKDLVEITSSQEFKRLVDDYQIKYKRDDNVFRIAEIFETGGTFAYYPRKVWGGAVDFFVYEQPSEKIEFRGKTYGPQDYSGLFEKLQPTERKASIDPKAIVAIVVAIVALLTIFTVTRKSKRKTKKNK